MFLRHLAITDPIIATKRADVIKPSILVAITVTLDKSPKTGLFDFILKGRELSDFYTPPVTGEKCVATKNDGKPANLDHESAGNISIEAGEASIQSSSSLTRVSTGFVAFF